MTQILLELGCNLSFKGWIKFGTEWKCGSPTEIIQQMMVSSSNEIHLQSAFENLLQFLINKVEEKAFESASAKLFDKTAIQGKVRLNKT
jgi:hypothetical protein